MGERPFEREPIQGFGRGFSHGNGRGFYSQPPFERNQRDKQEEEWLSPVSDGRGKRDIPVSPPPHNTRVTTKDPTNSCSI